MATKAVAKSMGWVILVLILVTFLSIEAGQEGRSPLLASWEQHVKLQRSSEFGWIGFLSAP